jgi:two-component system CheB/CheR fusion protein
MERGGPSVTSAPKDGFGMKLMRGEIGYRLGGEVETKFEPEGLTVFMSFPLN